MLGGTPRRTCAAGWLLVGSTEKWRNASLIMEATALSNHKDSLKNAFPAFTSYRHFGFCFDEALASAALHINANLSFPSTSHLLCLLWDALARRTCYMSIASCEHPSVGLQNGCAVNLLAKAYTDTGKDSTLQQNKQASRAVRLGGGAACPSMRPLGYNLALRHKYCG
ncbi:hypothetical protein TcWFU_010042 [Taenia crassiceps]|uniref:Uncharacterized protein n=1 Tax=Taenia crassiceps TaxID=6207 RepID=A0ABR4Q0T1_9CEST